MDVSAVKVGDIVLYTLQKKDMPVNPSKLWKGQVISVSSETEQKFVCVNVLSLEAGYEGLTELVYRHQIIQIEGSEER